MTQKNTSKNNSNLEVDKNIEQDLLIIANATNKSKKLNDVDKTLNDKHIVRNSDAENRVENTNEILILKHESEIDYKTTVRQIIRLSKDNLESLRKDKISLREDFVNFFKQILGIQLTVLIAFLFFNSASVDFDISDKVLITFMSSIFVETLGCIILMIKYAFKSDEEVQIIKTLNAIVQKYQKFK